MILQIPVLLEENLSDSFSPWLQKLLRIFFDGELPNLQRVINKNINISSLVSYEKSLEHPGLVEVDLIGGDYFLTNLTEEQIHHLIAYAMGATDVKPDNL